MFIAENSAVTSPVKHVNEKGRGQREGHNVKEGVDARGSAH